MGKNNLQIVRQKTVNQRQRFGLRKLSVGLASVMLGVTFFAGQGLVAHADSTMTSGESAVVTSDTSSEQVNAADSAEEHATTGNGQQTADTSTDQQQPAHNAQLATATANNQATATTTNQVDPQNEGHLLR